MRALARYACVGAAATALHYAVLVALVNWTATPPPAAAATGAVLGAQLAYLGNRAFTFTDRRPWWASWWRFQATAVLGAVLSASLVALGTRIGVHYLAAQACATLLAMGVTFLVNRRHTFG